MLVGVVYLFAALSARAPALLLPCGACRLDSQLFLQFSYLSCAGSNFPPLVLDSLPLTPLLVATLRIRDEDLVVCLIKSAKLKR